MTTTLFIATAAAFIMGVVATSFVILLFSRGKSKMYEDSEKRAIEANELFKARIKEDSVFHSELLLRLKEFGRATNDLRRAVIASHIYPQFGCWDVDKTVESTRNLDEEICNI